MLFYVYEHWRPDKDTCFWVGKGKGRRAYNFSRNSRYNRTVAKLIRLGMCVEVRLVADGLTEDEAFVIEKQRIAFWRANGGALTNMTDGGEGVSGLKHSPESIARVVARNLGRKHSQETRAKMSAARMGRPMSDVSKARLSAAHTGKKQAPHTPEHRAKISAAAKGRKDPPETKKRKQLAALNRPPQNAEVRSQIGAKVTALWDDPEYRARLTAAHENRAPASEATREAMRVAQRARRAANPVSAETRERQRAGIKAWHRRAGHKITDEV